VSEPNQKRALLMFVSLSYVQAHFIFEMLAYATGFRYYLYLRQHLGDTIIDDQRIGVIIGGIMGAAVFSKTLGFLEHPQLFALAYDNIMYIFASKTIVGGLIGGVIGVEITKKILKIKSSTGDLFCFPIIAGMMIGRLGCFFAGSDDGTWGYQTDWITGMDGGDGVIRHPMPLYEIVILATIWLTLRKIKHKVNGPDGVLFQIFMVSYLSWRLIAEFFKPTYVIDPIGLSAIQISCTLGLLYYHKTILSLVKLGKM
jgi:phosphatidylglycerol---prolipoprotein diacylglyceryl transferase